jgi:tetratricopeptide (TPR) repeat protein
VIQRDRIAVYLAIATMAAAALALGGAMRWGVVLVSFLAIGSACLLLGSQRTPDRLSPLVVWLLAAVALTAAQLLPLPGLLVRWLAPATYELSADGARAVREAAPAWLSLSQDPSGTWLELAKLVGYLAFAWTALWVCARRKGRKWLLAAVALTGTGMALIGLIHYLVQAERLFGWYAPQMASPVFIAPLLNPNHYSCLLALAAAVCAGLALHEQGRARMVWLAPGAICVATCMLLESRGGVVALAVGLLITVGLAVASRRRSEASPRERVAGAVIGLSLLALIVGVTASGAARELAKTDLGHLASESKVSAWSSGLTLIEQHPLTGVGRGAFAAAFPRFHPDSAHHTYTHLENQYLQAAADWGVVGALVLAWLAAHVLVQAVQRWRRDYLACGALGGCAAVAAQSAVDFAVELPGVALPALATLATLTYRPLQAQATPLQTRRRAQILAGVAVAAAAVVAVAVGPWATPLHRQRRQFRTWAEGTSQPTGPTAAQVQKRGKYLMERYPADYLIPGVVAFALYRARDPAAVRFVNRALTLHPTHPGLHQLAARILRRAGRREQARLEYELAILHSGQPGPLIAEVIAVNPEPAQAAQALPVRVGLSHTVVQHLLQQRAFEVAYLYAKRATASHPADVPTLTETIGAALARQDLATALWAARRAEELAPSPATAIRLAEVLHRAQNYPEAAQMARQGLRRATAHLTRLTLMMILAEAQAAQQHYPDARRIMVDVLRMAGSNPGIRRRAHLRLAELERRMGNLHRAQWEEQRAQALESNQHAN